MQANPSLVDDQHGLHEAVQEREWIKWSFEITAETKETADTI